MNYLLIPIMAVGRKHENNHFGVVNLIDEAVLLGDATTPLSCAVTRERFWFSSSSAGMLFQFRFQFQQFLKGFGLFAFELPGIFNGLPLVYDGKCHYPTRAIRSSIVSPSSKRYEGPFFASSTLWKNSSLVKRVGSSFSATSLRRYFTARLSRFSSSAITLMERSISALSCIAVMT